MSRVIFKMSFKHPNFKETTSKNMSHVEYIATRPGTDKTMTESDLTKELEKGVESLLSDDETYLQYIDKRPKSHGLFGQDGIEDLKNIKEEMSELKSYVWRGIVSLKENDAKELGYLNKNQWQDMLRKKIPDMAHEMKIPINNLRWVGAVHMEKGHPHAHIMLWEKEPLRTVGVVNNKTLNNIRKMFTDEIFAEERFQLMNDRTLMRELINDLTKADISKATNLIKEVRNKGQELELFIEGIHQEGITPKLYSEEEKQIATMVKELAYKLPGKGRIALKLMPENIKDEVRAIADYLLMQSEMSASLAKNLNSIEELTKMYTGKEDAIIKARNNAYRDIRDRISQIILKGTVESLKDNILYVDKELSQNAVEFIKNINNHINIIPEQTKILNRLALDLTRNSYSDEKIFEILKTFTVKININFPDNSIKNIIEQAQIVEVENQNISFLLSSKKINSYLSTFKIAEFSESEAFSGLKNIIEKDNNKLNNKLNTLEKDGFFKKHNEEYILTNKGIEEMLKVKEFNNIEKNVLKILEDKTQKTTGILFEDILENKNMFVYEKNILKNTLVYLEKLGLITNTDGEYKTTNKYFGYMKDIGISKKDKILRTSKYISADICKLIDNTQNKINVEKAVRSNEKLINDIHTNDTYKDIKTNYEDIRASYGIVDTTYKTINNLSTTLLISGITLEETKYILTQWNLKSNANIEDKKLDEIINKAYKTVSDNSLWGKTTVISSKNWKEMFTSLGFEEDVMPKWIYKGENWKSFNHNMGLSIINDIWKSSWKELEKQRMQSETQAEYMKKQMSKQQSANQSKGAIKEQIKKSKDKGSLYKDDELEI